MRDRTAASALLAASLVASLALGACSAAPSPTPRPTPSATPTLAPATATPSPSEPAQGQLLGACLKQVNQPDGEFTSYMDASLNWDGPPPQKVLLIVEGTNNDQALSLTPTGSIWTGKLGMHEVGPKTIGSLFVVNSDGSGTDWTAALAGFIGGGVFEVREGGTDGFGTCDV